MIWGENGSGKTSFLEAVHILSYGKSFKTSRHKDVIKKDSASYIVRGLYGKNGASADMMKKMMVPQCHGTKGASADIMEKTNV